jgi:hypothetical protein
MIGAALCSGPALDEGLAVRGGPSGRASVSSSRRYSGTPNQPGAPPGSAPALHTGDDGNREGFIGRRLEDGVKEPMVHDDAVAASDGRPTPPMGVRARREVWPACAT